MTVRRDALPYLCLPAVADAVGPHCTDKYFVPRAIGGKRCAGTLVVPMSSSRLLSLAQG